MEDSTVFTICKENIQPLRHGRNPSQLGTALRAQEDVEAQQMLLQEKQRFEELITNYDGDDPLDKWYDYILWVEQSYPKSGHESPLNKLLHRCLAIFEKETKYYQDRRYTRLWINYISCQQNPTELYQLLYNRGVGTMIADLYRAWAFELEQLEDYKKADEVYRLGISVRAEPLIEIDHAHKNFQMSLEQRTIERNERRNDTSLTEQRQAFSSLKAILPGKRVGTMRTGSQVRSYHPGAIPQNSHGSKIGPKANTEVEIYQDDFVDGEIKGSSILDYVATDNTVHKENALKPGPWNTPGPRKPLLPPDVKTAFEIHEDQIDDKECLRVRLPPNHVKFADASREYDSIPVPVFVPVAPNPTVAQEVHYPKDIVYADLADISLEEIKAQQYFEKLRRAQQDISGVVEMSHSVQQSTHEYSTNQLEKFSYGQDHTDMQQQYYMAENQRLEQQRRAAEEFEIQKQLEIKQAADLERKKKEMELENKRLEAQRIEAERLEAERIELQRIEAERIEAQRMEAEMSRQQKLDNSGYMSQQEDNHFNQSMTVNTKEARSVIQALWQSPEDSRMSVSSNHRIPNVAPPKANFSIHMDSSMTMSNNKPSQNYNIQQVHSYDDQENQRHYHNSYIADEAQNAYGNVVPMQNRYYQPHPEHMQQSMHHHQQQHSMIQPPRLQSHIQSPHQQSNASLHMQTTQHSRSMTPQHVQHHQPGIEEHQQSFHQQQQISHMQSPHLQSYHSPHIQHHQHQHPQQMHHGMHIQPQHHQQLQLEHQHMQSSQHMMTPHHHQPNLHPQQTHPPHLYNDGMGGYQQYMQQAPSPHVSHQQTSLESEDARLYMPYTEANTSKPYRMPELPYIKSPGNNRRGAKYQESPENKENSILQDYNRPVSDESSSKLPAYDDFYSDEGLAGIAPLPDNETSYMEAFNPQLPSSTPNTMYYKMKPDCHQYPNAVPQQLLPNEGPRSDSIDKLSTIFEATRENYTNSLQSNFDVRPSLPPELDAITEQSSLQENDQLTAQLYEQKMRARVQAVHAQSPRTVQRNVDQITSDIQNNCDLRKNINFALNDESSGATLTEKLDPMDYEEHQPMEQSQEQTVEEEEPYELPEGDINPFNKNIIAGLLRKIKFPRPHHTNGYVVLNTNVNKLVAQSTLMLGNDMYDLENSLGKGTYGAVFKAVNVHTRKIVAMKTQRPPWVWEYYIAREIKSRLTNPHMLRGFMDIDVAYVTKNCSILVCEFSKYGTLLNVQNQIKQSTGKYMHECLAVFFTIEMLQIIEYLHKCRIIHGDIKPDNFLVMHTPSEVTRPTIQLIDFGCSIDMSLFPENTKFTQVIKTEEFTCIEMQTGKPWTYQTDLYCLAGSSHVLLFGDYMRISHIRGRWFINSKIPRYAKKTAWETFFTKLLNIESCDDLPDLAELREVMEEALSQCTEKETKLRNLSNLLNKR